ncbi:hypothetical protein ANCDUO_07688, partial [Ancylostoma duodenale]
MADIGAAPFTSAPNLPLPALVVRPKRRFKVSTPVIKLPKRRTLDVGSGLDVSERSSVASASSVENVTRVKQRGRGRTVVTMAGDIDKSLSESVNLGHSPSKPVKVTAENKSEQSTSQSSSMPKKDVVRRRGKRARASGSTEGEKGPPAKIKDIGTAPVADRPKRLSAGKTLDFLAEETSSCSTPEDAPATSSKESESLNMVPAAPAHPISSPKREVPENEVKQDAPQSIAERVVDQEASNDTMEQDSGTDTSYSPSSASGSVDSAEGDKATDVKHSTRSSSKEDKGPEQKNITPEVNALTSFFIQVVAPLGAFVPLPVSSMQISYHLPEGDEESGKEKDSPALTSPKAEVVSSPMDEFKPAGEVDTTPQAAQDPAEVVPPETSSKPAPVVTPVHTMETRRRSLGKKARPIKIKLRLGCFPRVIPLNAGNENKTEEPESSKPAVPEAPVVKKAPAKKYISPWSRYIPSVKPVLGNIYYSDGTVEKLGVSVNAVMDRLLAEVCKDGITRHSAIVNKREKRK